MDRLEKLKQIIASAKVKPDRVHPDWAFHRAWNEALEFVERQIQSIEGESHGSTDR